jgi:hypothetical protein
LFMKTLALHSFPISHEARTPAPFCCFHRDQKIRLPRLRFLYISTWTPAACNRAEQILINTPSISRKKFSAAIKKIQVTRLLSKVTHHKSLTTTPSIPLIRVYILFFCEKGIFCDFCQSTRRMFRFAGIFPTYPSVIYLSHISSGQ